MQESGTERDRVRDARATLDGDGAVVAPWSLVDGAERAVRDWLTPGRFREGERLPTEEELARMLVISRGTLRAALRRLEQSGEIVRRQGSGTFVGRLRTAAVRGPSIVVPWLRPESFMIWAPGGPFRVIDITVSRGPVDGPAAAALHIVPGTHCVVIRRVITAGGALGAVSRDFLHPDLALPDLDTLRAEMGSGGTMHGVLAATIGIALSRQSTRVSSVLVDPAQPDGRRLGLDAATACVELRELAEADGRPTHWARDVLLPDRIEVEIVQSAPIGGPLPVGARGAPTAG